MKLMKAPARYPKARPEIERFIDRMFGAPFFEFPDTTLETEWSPSLDCTETDKDFVVRLEAPGVHKENLDVNLEGNMLTLTGKREFQTEQKEEEYIWREREEGRFVRSLRLPKPVAAKDISAIYENGVLTVRLPKQEPALKSKIAIK